MDIAEELAAQDMNVSINIAPEKIYILLFQPGGRLIRDSEIRQGPAIFDVIEGEIERLIEEATDETHT